MNKLRWLYFYIRAIFLEQKYLDRVVYEQETAKLLLERNISQMIALEISGRNFSKIPFMAYESATYPEFDICSGRLPRQFDIIIADQVFEHLLWPYRAGRNVYDMLNDGGYFLVITPFLQKIHNYPVDCSRWSEVGLKHFLAECGFSLERIITGSWGTKQAARANLSEARLTDYPLYNPLVHRNMKANKLFPVQVWALAHRIGDESASSSE